MNIVVIESSKRNSGILKVTVQNNKPVTLPMGTSFLFRLRPAPFPKAKYLEEKRNILTNFFLTDVTGIVATLAETAILSNGDHVLKLIPNHPEIPSDYICSNSLDLLDMAISIEDAMHCSKLADLLKT